MLVAVNPTLHNNQLVHVLTNVELTLDLVCEHALLFDHDGQDFFQLTLVVLDNVTNVGVGDTDLRQGLRARDDDAAALEDRDRDLFAQATALSAPLAVAGAVTLAHPVLLVLAQVHEELDLDPRVDARLKGRQDAIAVLHDLVEPVSPDLPAHPEVAVDQADPELEVDQLFHVSHNHGESGVVHCLQLLDDAVDDPRALLLGLDASHLDLAILEDLDIGIVGAVQGHHTGHLVVKALGLFLLLGRHLGHLVEAAADGLVLLVAILDVHDANVVGHLYIVVKGVQVNDCVHTSSCSNRRDLARSGKHGKICPEITIVFNSIL